MDNCVHAYLELRLRLTTLTHPFAALGEHPLIRHPHTTKPRIFVCILTLHVALFDRGVMTTLALDHSHSSLGTISFVTKYSALIRTDVTKTLGIINIGWGRRCLVDQP